MAARQYFIPGKGYVNEVNTNQFQIPLVGFLNSTAASPSPPASLTTVTIQII